MKKISDYLGKPIIGIFEGKTLGTVKNITFDKNFKNAKWIISFDNNEIVDEKAIRLNNVFSVGKDAIMVKNEGLLSPVSNYENIITENNPINKKIYTILGDYLGKVKDVFLGDKNKITKIILDTDKKIEINQILSQGNQIIILKDPVVKISKIKPKRPPMPKEEYKKIKVWAMDELENQNPNLESATPPKPIPENFNTNTIINTKNKMPTTTIMPNKVVVNSSFLIGRKTGKTLKNEDNKTIIKKGVIITPKIIKTAHENNKLNELTANSFITE